MSSYQFSVLIAATAGTAFLIYVGVDPAAGLGGVGLFSAYLVVS